MINEYSENDVVFVFNKNTKEYIGTDKAIVDLAMSKIKGKTMYRASACTTFVKPPETQKNEVVIYKNGYWKICKDFRGSIYYQKNGDMVTITEINEVIPEWAVLTPPPFAFKKPVYIDGTWIDSKEPEPLDYKGYKVYNTEDVDVATTKIIRDAGEDKAKTEKMLVGNGKCSTWNNFLTTRKRLLEDGRKFKEENFPQEKK